MDQEVSVSDANKAVIEGGDTQDKSPATPPTAQENQQGGGGASPLVGKNALRDRRAKYFESSGSPATAASTAMTSSTTSDTGRSQEGYEVGSGSAIVGSSTPTKQPHESGVNSDP